ncbi:ulp1 protease family, C-terminal catalytic domain-containing protein [Artemisia annua]|uniref:Ulp1 protease family, C-terminal catalytic domain-containing protein n=1 Tax=Artemisia annua TaxID=35608 RepID=A0A2U1LF11_ARTAN|nr:ulp1 protease family, C-terminal catalytic domain-containing protein [Artemisia annua]
MFPKASVGDAAADDRAVDEEIDNEELDEDVGWEDDLFEENGGESIPENAEVMKKKLSSYLKRVGDLIDMSDRLLVKGLEDNPDDHGFMELKELRDQMFVNRKYYHNPEDNEDPTKEAYDKCFTPGKGVNLNDSGAPDEYVFPFTQVYGMPTEIIAMSDIVCREWECNHQHIPTRLDFEDDGEFDLNLTQPPATQEPADDGDFKTPDHPISVRAHESHTSNRLSRFGRESLGNKSKDIVPVYPDPLPLNVLLPKREHSRAQPEKLLPEVYRSPYMTREVSVGDVISKHEQKDAECFFSARFTETDIVFKTRFVDGERVVLESLFPGIELASGAINLFTHVLNNAEKHRNKMTVTRVFCHTSMLVFFPVIQWRHFFVVCMNMKDGEVKILDNLLLPDKAEDERFTWFVVQLVLQLGCMIANNFVDCGMFTMRHMETYRGDGADLCCLSKEGKKQLKELRDLHIKYAVKILLSDCNLVKSDIDKEVHAFRSVPDEEKKGLQKAAFETIKSRVTNKFEVK